MDEEAVRGLRLVPAVHAATAGGCDALDLLHASVCLKLGLQHILQAFCIRAACQLPNDSAIVTDGVWGPLSSMGELHVCKMPTVLTQCIPDFLAIVEVQCMAATCCQSKGAADVSKLD